MKDVAFGFKAAKAIGAMDLGQTVVVKNQAVMAVEAIEGTDACIRRGGMLARGGSCCRKDGKTFPGYPFRYACGRPPDASFHGRIRLLGPCYRGISHAFCGERGGSERS